MRFFDCNATRTDARQSSNPCIVRFDIVRAKNQGDVEKDLQRFYQAEVLVPYRTIVFPKKPVARFNVVKAVHQLRNSSQADVLVPTSLQENLIVSPDESKAHTSQCDVSADGVRENVESAVNSKRTVQMEVA